MIISRIHRQKKSINKNLPDGYKQVEFIETPEGSQSHIDTGIAAKIGVGISAKYKFKSFGRKYDQVQCGGGGYRPAYQMVFAITNYTHFTCSNGNSLITDYELNLGDKFNVFLDSSTLLGSFENETLGTSYIFELPTHTQTEVSDNIAIFCRLRDGNVEYYGGHVCYSFKVYVSGVLAREYIPCIKEDTQEVGLYEVFTQEFHTRTDFIAGEEV